MCIMCLCACCDVLINFFPSKPFHQTLHVDILIDIHPREFSVHSKCVSKTLDLTLHLDILLDIDLLQLS